MGYRAAVKRALAKLDAREVETSWSDALYSSQGDREPLILSEREGMLFEHRERTVQATPETIYAVFTRLGGRQGWLTFTWAWQLRGMADRLVGGVGFRRGRRNPVSLRVGDAVDFWRVEDVMVNRSLRLRAEMRVPGRAWLQFEVKPSANGESTLTQTALFAPKGLVGVLYWYMLYPIHGPIFSSMIDALKASAEKEESKIPEAQIPKNNEIKQQGLALGLALLLPFVAAAIGGAATASSVSTWYRTLRKPSWNPPAWIFGPVWTLLYTMMGVASWLVWKEGRKGKASDLATDARSQGALGFYGVHLAFNALWSILFFGMKRLDLAAAEIGVLWSMIAATAARFYQIKPLAGLLLVPYLLWATFASILNITLWRINRKK